MIEDTMLEAIREIASHPEFDELIIRGKRLSKSGTGWCVQQSYGSCDLFERLEEAVRFMDV